MKNVLLFYCQRQANQTEKKSEAEENQARSGNLAVFSVICSGNGNVTCFATIIIWKLNTRFLSRSIKQVKLTVFLHCDFATEIM